MWELCCHPSAFTPCDCTRALLSHVLSLSTEGQDVAGWDPLMGDLSPGWCPKESQCKSTGAFSFFVLWE